MTILEKRRSSFIPMLLVIVAMFYNAILALINAHLSPITQNHVIASEVLILALAGTFILRKKYDVRPYMPFIWASAFFYILLFFVVSFGNSGFFIKSLRDVFIIFVFYILGTQCSNTGLIKGFRIAVIALLASLVMEGWFLEIYGYLLNPSRYYFSTRGIEEFSLDSSGVFRNSLGFEGRFSYDLFGNRRLSGLFLEQVSLANFAIILSVFTLTLWKQLLRKDRILFLISILFMILSNSSRTGTALCIIMLVGYFLFPRLPKRGYIWVFGVTFLLAALLSFKGETGDTLAGRLGHSISMIANMDWTDITLGNIHKIPSAADSGYSYLIYSQTIFGLLYFIFFLWKTLPYQTPETQRFSYGCCLYIAVNLLIGAAILSIKVSAPLWILVGFLSKKNTSHNKQIYHK